MITCGVTSCRESLDDDSIFCDICGAVLWSCAKCGASAAPGQKFCGKDGGKILKRLEATLQHYVPAQGSDRGTTRMLPKDLLTLIEPKTGTEFRLQESQIFGRASGPYAEILSSLSEFMSSSHGKFEHRDSRWFFQDLRSTNGSKIDGDICSPEVAIELKNGCLIEMADLKLKVRI